MAFVSDLLQWYQQNARRLPWRSSISPYRTWVSEIMLQQTQVDTVIPYFEHWMAALPSLADLAAADEQDVLSLWEGLGYYRRARNLHLAAKIVMRDHEGCLPEQVAELEKLPGIGRYTAAAIASIAFGQDVAVVEGNVRRVISRLFNLTEPIRSPVSEREIWRLAQSHLPPGEACAYNQAWMDLGSLICTPKSPSCDSCPIAAYCQARLLKVQEDRPVRAPKKHVPHLIVAAAIIHQEDKVLIARRPVEGLLGGLWEFPGGTLEDKDADLSACLVREIEEELGVSIVVDSFFGRYQHAYTHFKITLHAFLCQLADDRQPRCLACDDWRWVSLAELSQYPMGKVDRLIANRLMVEGLPDE